MAPIFVFETRPNCPACSGPDHDRLYSAPLNSPQWTNYLSEYYRQPVELEGNYVVDRCRTCRTMWQRDVGNEALLGTLYNEWVKPVPPEQEPEYLYNIAHPLESRDGHEIMAAASYLGLSYSLMVTLDYGMGWALWARTALALGCNSYGFDLAKERREFAEARGVRTAIDGEQFHFINTEQLIEHVVDPVAVVGDLAGRLRPGGVLKISVPSQKGVAETLEELGSGKAAIEYERIMPIFPLEHVNCFSEEGLRLLGQRFGLEPVKPSYWHRFAFLRRTGSVGFRQPKRAIKELVRPWYQWRNPANLYVWLRRKA